MMNKSKCRRFKQPVYYSSKDQLVNMYRAPRMESMTEQVVSLFLIVFQSYSEHIKEI